MAKNSLRQYDPVAANNTDIGSISLQENITKPSDVNNFERTAMSHIAQYLTEMSYPTAGGTANALTLTPTTALAALASNQAYTFTAASANTTAATLAVSGLTAKAIRKIVGGTDVALVANDIQANGRYTVVYDTAANSAAGAWIITTSSPNPTVREILTASRTYYVRTDGSDSNTGQADTSGGAFLTIAKALSAAASLDCSTFNVTVQVRSGTWSVPVVLPQLLGSGTFTLTGDTSTPSNVLVSVTSANCITASGISTPWVVQGFKLAAATAGAGIYCDKNSSITFNSMDFGACTTVHCDCESGGIISANGNYAISAGTSAHWYAVGGRYAIAGKTITISGTPAFSTAFAYAVVAGTMSVNNNTFSGSATGVRYNVQENSVVHTNGGGATYLPGGTSGTTATGGQYT